MVDLTQNLKILLILQRVKWNLGSLSAKQHIRFTQTRKLKHLPKKNILNHKHLRILGTIWRNPF